MANEEGISPYSENIEYGFQFLIRDYRFTRILHKEAQDRGLMFEDVAACAKSLYCDLLPPGYDRYEIVIRDRDFTAKEGAALISIMRLKDPEWYDPVCWRRDSSGKAGEENS